MSSVSIGEARAILGNSLFCVGTPSVPYTRDELYRYRSGQFSVFFIPPGSLCAFPKELTAVHECHACNDSTTAWARTDALPHFVVAHPRTETHLYGMPLCDQRERIVGGSILDPYEIAVMGAYWARANRGPLFQGGALTEEVMFVSTWTTVRTIVACLSYSRDGILRIGGATTTEIASDRAVMVGKRRYLS